MKKFKQLHMNDQLALLATGLNAVADAGPGKGIEQVARAEGKSPQEWWHDVCADTGLDECEPWQGFPELPAQLPPAPGGDRPLPEHVADALSKLMGPTKQ
jgi:hypothetical protein